MRALKKVKEIGYSFVQLFGLDEVLFRLANCCKEIDLPVSGILTNLDSCYSNTEQLFEIAKICGAKDIGISAAATDPYDIVRRSNEFALIAKKAGLTFSYHNHGYEFEKTKDNITVMDIYIRDFNENVLFMPDTYWVQYGGTEVRGFLDRLGTRIGSLHLKDMKLIDNKQTFAEIGQGNLNMLEIIKTAEKYNVRDFIVEQDECDGDPLYSVAKSFDFLRKYFK